MPHSHRSNQRIDPVKFTLREWTKRGLSLHWREILRRILKLLVKTIKNYFVIQKLHQTAKNEGKSVLFIILTERLGDIIAGHPAAAGLEKPSQKIVWLVRDQYENMLKFNAHISNIVTVSSYTETIFLRKIFKEYEWKDLQPDGYLCNMFGVTIKNPNKFGINRENYYEFGTLSDIYSLIGLGHKSESHPKIYKDDGFDVERYLAAAFSNPNNGYIAIHVSSDDAARSWPAEKCQNLMDMILKETNFNIIEFGLTPTLTENKRVSLVKNALPLSQQISLMETAKFL